MEETQQKKERVVTKNVEKEEVGGETSRAAVIEESKKKEEDYVKVVIDVDLAAEKKTPTLEDRLKKCLREACDDDKEGSSSTAGNNNPEKIPDIPLVPKALREKKELKKYFEPTIISIGPYHHGKENLKGGESLKLQWAIELLKLPPITRKEGENNNWEMQFDKVLKEIKDLRACYDDYDASSNVKEVDKYDDETLAWMLFVDGCSVLYYINCCLGHKFIALNLNNSDIAILQQDLILLENQLPYRVLELFTGLVFSDSTLEVMDDFLRWFINKPPGRVSKEERLVLKLLNWFRRRIEGDQSKKPSHLLEILHRTYIAGAWRPFDLVTALTTDDQKEEYDWCSFHNVTELTAKGINLKTLHRHEGLIDIAFNDYNPFLIPKLALHPITIDNTTKTKLLNLIALEMSSSSKSRSYVTSYICFLNSLISDKDDVKELRAAHILHDFLGSNEELAKFFKEIVDNLVPDYKIYSPVLSRIEQYLERRRSIIWSWTTEGTRIYLRSPWKVIAIFAGCLAISLSIVQTYFTIFPLPDKCN